MLTLGFIVLAGVMVLDAALPFFLMGKSVETNRVALIIGLLLGVIAVAWPLFALFSASDSPGRIALLAAALVCLGAGMTATLVNAGRSRYVSPTAAILNLVGNAIILVCATVLYATV